MFSLSKNRNHIFWEFFEYFGYPVVRSNLAHLRGWNKHWYLGEYEKIFNDPVFRNNQVFEDAPFWAKNFYKILYKEFPDAKFILLTRYSNAWFDSLVRFAHSGVLGYKRFHAKNYENPAVLEVPNFNISEHRAYYTQFYEMRNQDIIHFFQNEEKNFLHLELEDSEKWQNLGNFLDLAVPENFEIHARHKTNKIIKPVP